MSEKTYFRPKKLNLKEKLNLYGKQKEPFLFVIDFDLKNYDIVKLKDLEKNRISFQIDNDLQRSHDLKLHGKFIEYKEYKKRFDKIQENIENGNTYLLNLTSPTLVKNKIDLKEVYEKSNARFKLFYKDRFVCFSPERFCRIKEDKIYTYPMKGTIDANIKDAEDLILNNQKELAEHTMVVDLLRNDLSIVSKNVKVEKFRYIDKIKAGEKELLQVSSKISGKLDNNWNEKIGDILIPLLPAGSITGTPKKITAELIKKIENYDRGFFTGVFGVYDGKTLDSAVMIRFIQKNQNGDLIYKSGGGITCDSDPKKEYQEMCDKVYIP